MPHHDDQVTMIPLDIQVLFGQYRGNATVGTLPNLKPAKGYGVWGQLMYYPIDPLGFVVGYERRNILDAQEYRNAPPTDEKYNENIYGNISYDLNHAVRFAVEYERLTTSHLGIPPGATDNKGHADRFQVSAIYFF